MSDRLCFSNLPSFFICKSRCFIYEKVTDARGTGRYVEAVFVRFYIFEHRAIGHQNSWNCTRFVSKISLENVFSKGLLKRSTKTSLFLISEGWQLFWLGLRALRGDKVLVLQCTQENSFTQLQRRATSKQH